MPQGPIGPGFDKSGLASSGCGTEIGEKIDSWRRNHENRESHPREWACGAAGSALPWHGRGHRFDPGQVHQPLRIDGYPIRPTTAGRVFLSHDSGITFGPWTLYAAQVVRALHCREPETGSPLFPDAAAKNRAEPPLNGDGGLVRVMGVSEEDFRRSENVQAGQTGLL